MPILCYHGVQPDWKSPLAMHPDAFDRQCAWLARRRRVVDLAKAVQTIGRRGDLPRGVASLTFDDGFASVYDHAFPILVRHRLPATVFLVTNTLTASGQPVDWVDDAGSTPLPTLSRDQVLEMQSAGIAFGSHSHSHHDLTTMTEEECVRDLRTSREFLEDLLHGPVPFVAYPRGRHTPRVREAARRAGFTHGFALPEGREAVSLHALPRVGLWAGNGLLALRLKTSCWYLPLRTSRAGALPKMVLHRNGWAR